MLLQIRDRVIEEGIASAMASETDKKLAGALEGFEIARSLNTRDDFQEVLHTRRNAEQRMMFEFYSAAGEDKERMIKEYWKHRYATLQVEFVLDRMLVAGWADEGELVSANAVMHVARIQEVYPQA